MCNNSVATIVGWMLLDFHLQSCVNRNYRIIWIVHAFWLVNLCVFTALWSTKMTRAIWLLVSKSWLLQFHESNYAIHNALQISSFALLTRKIITDFIKEIRLRLGFSLICSQILPNVRFGFHWHGEHVLFLK